MDEKTEDEQIVELLGLNLSKDIYEKRCFVDNGLSRIKNFYRRQFKGDCLDEYLDNMNILMEKAFPLEHALCLVECMNEFIDMGRDSILRCIKKYKTKIWIRQSEFIGLLDDFIKNNYLVQPKHREVIRVIFACVSSAVEAENEESLGSETVSAGFFMLAQERINSHSLYMNAKDNLTAESDQLTIAKHMFELSWALHSLETMKILGTKESDDILKKAVYAHGTKKMHKRLARDRNPEKIVAAKIVKKYAEEYANPAWDNGCKLLHIQMEKLLKAVFELDVDEEYFSEYLKNSVPSENLVFGNSGAQKNEEVCPCDNDKNCCIAKEILADTFYDLSETHKVKDNDVEKVTTYESRRAAERAIFKRKNKV